jgi:ribonuclease Y
MTLTYNLLELLVPFFEGILAALLISWLLFRRWTKLSDEKQRILIQVVQAEAEAATLKIRETAESDLVAKRQEMQQIFDCRQQELAVREKEFEESRVRQLETIEKYEHLARILDERILKTDQRSAACEALMDQYRVKLQALTGITIDQAKSEIIEEIRRESEDELRQIKSELLQKGEVDLTNEARRVLVDCMQRIASVPHYDITATIVPLPSEDMKGRIIGREGRNIKSFESATGTTLLIDETPDSVLISSFDPVRREVARIALENLIRDGRIHPTSIEDAVEYAREQVQRSVTEFGEDALRRLRINHVHPEIIALLGKLRYRLSNNQNSLDHSIEVANLCALIAAELQLDVHLAKRAGLFHDIGKSLDAEYEGSHAIAGSNFLKRTGEGELVVNAVAAHHEEVPVESAYGVLVMIADSLSAVRPGARAENMDAYIQRVKNLETLAKCEFGVQEVYAVQAGREIRVIVSPEKMTDEETRAMARRLRRRIEDELQYPGTIRITVIREMRVVEQAR